MKTHRKRILIIGMSSNFGGIEQYIYNLVKNSNLNYIDYSFLYFNNDKMAFEKELKELGCKIYKITSRTKNRKKFIDEIKKVYALGFDIIHYNIMSYSCFEPIYLIKYYPNTKIIVHSHSAGFEKNVHIKTFLFHMYGKFRTRNINIVRVACSDKASKFMFGNANTKILYNGVDYSKYIYNEGYRNEIRNELGINNDTLVFGLVAAFLKIKNHEFLIKIFKKYLEYDSNALLVLVGDGPLKKAIGDLVNKYQLHEKVIFLGIRNDVYKIYSAFDEYIMPSANEGFGISLLEAQINGLHCFASSNFDKSIDISKNIDFLQLEKGPDYWAKYIYNNVKKRERNIMNIISKKYEAQHCYSDTLKFYDELLDSNKEV